MAFQAFTLEDKTQRKSAQNSERRGQERQVSYVPQEENRQSHQKWSVCKLNVRDEFSRRSSIVCLLCSDKRVM